MSPPLHRKHSWWYRIRGNLISVAVILLAVLLALAAFLYGWFYGSQ